MDGTQTEDCRLCATMEYRIGYVFLEHIPAEMALTACEELLTSERNKSVFHVKQTKIGGYPSQNVSRET